MKEQERNYKVDSNTYNRIFSIHRSCEIGHLYIGKPK